MTEQERKGVRVCYWRWEGFKPDDMIASVGPGTTAYVRGDTAVIVDCRHPSVTCPLKDPRRCVKNQPC